MMTTETPSAKQQSFAAHNLADLAMVSFSDLPISLANAFEEPVKPVRGFLKPSIEELHKYWQAIHTGYGLDERTAQFALAAVAPEGVKTAKTLDELKTWVRTDGKG